LQLDLLRSDHAPQAETETASLVRRLHAGLNAAQRAEICFAWDHRDAEKGLLRKFIANHWQVTWPCVRGNFFSAEQRVLVHKIFCSLLDPDWVPRISLQLADDTKGHLWGQDQSIAIIGDPAVANWQFLFTGRHLTLRTGGAEGPETAFGGPVVYGHAAGGFWEPPGHPGNVFWPQAEATSRFFSTLDLSERIRAVVKRLPAEEEIGFRAEAEGLAVAGLTPLQKQAFEAVLAALLAPFRDDDKACVRRCLAAQGGAAALRIAFSRENRISAPLWDVWRIEGPSFVWHFQGWPHVHGWVHVAAAPSDGAVNGQRGAFLFPQHDPLL
jgi:hypothetical protein